MRLTQERLEALEATLDSEEDNLEFYDKLEGTENPHIYHMAPKEITFFGKETPEGDSKILRYLDRAAFLAEVENKELVGRIFLGWEKGKENNVDFVDWDEYSRRVGVSKLVTLSFKLPETVAKRFRFFANETSNPSAELRRLTIEYVIKKWKAEANRLIFKEGV